MEISASSIQESFLTCISMWVGYFLRMVMGYVLCYFSRYSKLTPLCIVFVICVAFCFVLALRKFLFKKIVFFSVYWKKEKKKSVMTKKSIVILSYTNKYFFVELTYRLNINIHLIFIQYFVYVSNFYLLYINQLIQKLFSEQHQFSISMLLYISLVHLL